MAWLSGFQADGCLLYQVAADPPGRMTTTQLLQVAPSYPTLLLYYTILDLLKLHLEKDSLITTRVVRERERGLRLPQKTDPPATMDVN